MKPTVAKHSASVSPDFESYRSNVEHIQVVQRLLLTMAHLLMERAVTHDVTKLQSPEREAFRDASKSLSNLVYGSQEYLNNLKELGEALDHHYAHNRHHPQFFEEGVNGMTLIDVLEMLVDSYASTSRNKDGDIYSSLQVNQERFGIESQLLKVMENTVPLIQDCFRGNQKEI